MADIRILENERPRTFTNARYVKTKLQSGGTCRWKPEDELTTKDKSISKNGSYSAEDEGLYGYKKVTVNVANAGSITGHGGSGTGVEGEDYSISVDPETGEIVEKILPSSIMIVTPPTKTEYTDGETIDYTGIQVRALDGHGEVWQDANHPDGIIPMSELILTETIAETGEGSDSKIVMPSGMVAYYFITSDWGNACQWRDLRLAKESGRQWPYYLTTDVPCDGLLVKQSGDTYLYYIWHGNPTVITNRAEDGTVTPKTKVIPQRVWGRFNFGYMYGTNDIEISPVLPTVGSGDDYGIEVGKHIPVQWQRPDDYKTLQASFTITVTSE